MGQEPSVYEIVSDSACEVDDQLGVLARSLTSQRNTVREERY
jgi:hypothetical protein